MHPTKVKVLYIDGQKGAGVRSSIMFWVRLKASLLRANFAKFGSAFRPMIERAGAEI
jgi:hypothetical protein